MGKLKLSSNTFYCLPVTLIEQILINNNLFKKKSSKSVYWDVLKSSELLDCIESETSVPKKFVSSYLDSYLHTNFKTILENLKTLKLIKTCSLNISNSLNPHCSESAFQKALEYELSLFGNVTRERYVPVYYKQCLVEQIRIDLEFKDFVIELKHIDGIAQKQINQIHAYLETTDYKKGILINFNCKCKNKIDTYVAISSSIKKE